MPSAFIAASLAANLAANDEAASRSATAVSDFLVREDTIDEPIAVPFDGGGNPGDFGRIDARTYDFHLRRSYMTLPAVPETFYWTDSLCGLALKCRPLDYVARHLFTTRELQLSFDGAWERIAGALGVGEVAGLNQVHGRDVLPSGAIRRVSLDRVRLMPSSAMTLGRRSLFEPPIASHCSWPTPRAGPLPPFMPDGAARRPE